MEVNAADSQVRKCDDRHVRCEMAGQVGETHVARMSLGLLGEGRFRSELQTAHLFAS